MDDVIYERQKSLPLSIPKAVAVVGCGGVGSWTAYFLALAGVEELWLFDSDTISAHNLNRIPLPADTVGKSKSLAVKGLIESIRPQCRVLAFGDFTPKLAGQLQMEAAVRYVIATTDTLRSRQITARWAAEHHIPYGEAAAEGDTGSATGCPADWQTEMENHPGYASVPVWIAPCAQAALLICNYVVHGALMEDRTIRCGWSPSEGITLFDSQVEIEEVEVVEETDALNR